MTDMREHLRRSGWLTLAATLLGAVALEAASNPWAQTLTQQALDSGFLSRLPPNVSVVLGLAKPDEGTDVRQLVSKEGHEVRTFNVSVANHADVVIFNVNAQSGATVAYLLTPAGQLRKAVSYQTGGQARELSEAQAKSGFAHEKQFWSARARKAGQGAAAHSAAPQGAAPEGAAAPAAATPPSGPGH